LALHRNLKFGIQETTQSAKPYLYIENVGIFSTPYLLQKEPEKSRFFLIKQDETSL